VRRVPITGVRGTTGAPLAGRLAHDGEVEVLGGSSNPSRVAIDGVRPTAFSWDDRSGWPAAATGADAVYVVRPNRLDAPVLIAALAATTPADAHLVLLSGQEAGPSVRDDWTLRAERAVRDSGRRWTVLRPSWFMQVFLDPRFYREQVQAGRPLEATLEHLHAGVYADVIDTVERVTGRPARPLDTLLADC
jgi:uncharacterized protein YbjT (DUF2867 family)